jgi:hypothetical protein
MMTMLVPVTAVTQVLDVPMSLFNVFLIVIVHQNIAILQLVVSPRQSLAMTTMPVLLMIVTLVLDVLILPLTAMMKILVPMTLAMKLLDVNIPRMNVRQ